MKRVDYVSLAKRALAFTSDLKLEDEYLKLQQHNVDDYFGHGEYGLAIDSAHELLFEWTPTDSELLNTRDQLLEELEAAVAIERAEVVPQPFSHPEIKIEAERLKEQGLSAHEVAKQLADLGSSKLLVITALRSAFDMTLEEANEASGM